MTGSRKVSQPPRTAAFWGYRAPLPQPDLDVEKRLAALKRERFEPLPIRDPYQPPVPMDAITNEDLDVRETSWTNQSSLFATDSQKNISKTMSFSSSETGDKNNSKVKPSSTSTTVNTKEISSLIAFRGVR